MAASSLLTMSATAAQQANSSPEEPQKNCNADPSLCEVVIADLRVSAKRLAVSEVGQSLTRLDVDAASSFRLDGLLSSVPGVSLFRRANSLTAHPTTQGINMRGVGANAAGRVLVTLDGVPLNDPFGGWVYWSAHDPSAFNTIHIRRGGSSGAFGAQSLAGVIELGSGDYTEPGATASASLFSDAGYEVSGGATATWEGGFMRATAGRFETEGDYLLAAEDRGAVDARAASEATRAGILLEHQLGDIQARSSVRYFREQRVNGLSLAVNETEALDASLSFQGQMDDGGWELITYYRDRQFTNVFASARDDRTTELAVLDQFDVPAWGAGVLARVQFDGLEFGVDGRRMSGETNEKFRNLGAGFTRQRRAGGDQWTLGLYGEYSHEADWGGLSATLRYDRWRTYNGERLEASIEDGAADFTAPLRDDDVPARKGGVWTGRVGLEREITGAIDLRAAAYKSWRLPTLNEYYRPFRVVNDITEANPNLRPETLYGVEVGVDYNPLNTVHFAATYYRNWLKDGVGNVTVGYGPGFFELGGFVPPGGVLRQRTNVDNSITDGVELEAQLDLQPGWQLSASYLYARARITAFDAMPDLVGNRPIQTPRHSLTMRAAYDGQQWGFDAGGRYSSSQFDDDQNTRLLGDIFLVNAGGWYRLGENLRLTATIDNLFDAKVVSAVTADGVETLAQRRFWRIGLEASF